MKKDELYDQAKAVFVRKGVISISLLQRELGTGYNRSCNIVEQMVEAGSARRISDSDYRFELIPEKAFTAEEVAAAVVDGNKVMVEKLEELCTRVATAEFQRDQALSMEKQLCERLGELARLSEVVCIWALENDITLPDKVRFAAEEILEYVQAVKPN